MKKLLKYAAGISAATLIMSGCGPSAEKGVAASLDGNCKTASQGAVVASKFDGDIKNMAAVASAWEKAACTSVMMYPQRTVVSNDTAADALMADAKGVKANVKALYNNDKVALMVYWDDSEASYQGDSSDKW